MKITKKFYVGSRSTIINGDWSHKNLEQAIQHAKQLVDETDEEQYIVQVIRVVKRKDSPIVVEKM